MNLPVFSRGHQHILFVHIPKTAGSSIEDYFAKGGWTVAYLDRSNPANPESSNYYRKVSPQHMHGHLLADAFDLSKFDLIFTVVRNPIQRFKSEFAYRHPELSDLEVSEEQVQDWWFRQKMLLAKNPSHLDNHLRHQSDFLIEGMSVIKYEEGFLRVTELANSFGSIQPKPVEIDSSMPRVGSSWNSLRSVPISKALENDLLEHYKVDYSSLGFLI